MFRGTKTDLLAFVVTSKARSLIEYHHAGFSAQPDDLVLWGNQRIPYKDVAKLSSVRLLAWNDHLGQYAQACYGLASKSPTRYTTTDRERIAFTLSTTTQWDLPDLLPLPPEERATLLTALRTPTPMTPAQAFGHLVEKDAFLLRFFQSATQGTTDHMKALRAGEPVFVHTQNGPVPWEHVSHMTNTDVKTLTKTFSSRLVNLIHITKDRHALRADPMPSTSTADPLLASPPGAAETRLTPERFALSINIPYVDKRKRNDPR